MQTFQKLAVIATTLVGVLTPSVSAHSWIEHAYKLAPNGTMVGDIGYARGYVPRNSTNPPFNDAIPVNLIPAAGQGWYSGDELLNKFKYETEPEFPMLEAAAGDYVALMHLENGHTSKPETQPKKPRNRGTIYFYGTTQPKENEKLFDVHLLWNKDGTGGDGRGKLLATRNYDDGQCYQPVPAPISQERAAKLAVYGASHDQELACQSDIKLPDDLKVGDVYTVYWYWDWPDLNEKEIDLEATSDGKFPWAGTFMRGNEDPNGFTVAAIAKNESYSSVIDIKITEPEAGHFSTKDKIAHDFVQDQNIYSMGIKEQMESNFQVDVDGGQGGGDAPSTSVVAAPTTAPASGGSDGGIATVTVTTTVQPPPLVTTIYVTGAPASAAPEPSTETKTIFTTRSRDSSQPAESASESSAVQPSPSTVVITMTTHVSHSTASALPETESPSSTQSTSTFYLTLTTRKSGVPSSTALSITESSAAPVTEPSNSAEPAPTSVETLSQPVADVPTSVTPIATDSSALSTAESSTSTQSTSTYVLTMTTHVSHGPSSSAAAVESSTFSYPGGQFRETPVTTADAPTTSTGSPSDPPIPTPFLRHRANWAFGAV